VGALIGRDWVGTAASVVVMAKPFAKDELGWIPPKRFAAFRWIGLNPIAKELSFV
jgi:hypothetical protein